MIELGEEIGLGTTPQTYIDANVTTSRGTDVTLTSWGVSFSIPSPWSTLSARNLRNRISRTMTDVDGDTTTTGDQVLTYYSYDPHGNVEWLVTKLPATDESLNPLVMCTAYDYDLISGKVKEVRLQPGRTDQFTQRYTYDHDQRITSVSTSRDGVTWEHEAAYAYFAHGPLKRMELGQDSVQGTDYAYTINGWLKGINMPSLNPDHDPGGDGAATGPNTGFARDAFGMILGYHEKDFVKSGSVYDSSHSTTSSWHVPNPTFLYNGNISSWAWNSRRASGATDTAMASVYHYDLLNRIRTDSTRLRGASAWSSVGSHWQSSYAYDGNGNIQTLYRANASGSQMDNLTYTYTSGTNKLINIDDYQGASTGADIGDQDGNNYAYDATGNMTQDTAAGIEAGGIVWSPYNKIKSITKMGDDTTSKLVYHYDATGNRILKRYYKPYNTLKSTTWYVRDAQGNTLATYTKPADSSTARQHEVMLYGSTRLAVAETQAPYSDSETDTLGIFDRVSSRTLGTKRYELTDHLGNVRATVSDVVIDHSGDLDAELSTRTDYYPFGMIMGGRNSSADDAHRYGFNGKENDNEVKGEGVQQDYGFRIYDARVARFLSVDPLSKDYPSSSTFSYAANRPIAGIDLEGLEYYYAADGKLIGKLGDSREVRLVSSQHIAEATTYIQWTLSSGNEKDKLFNYNKTLELSGSTGLTDQELKVRAFLSMIRVGEGTSGSDGYHKLYGGQSFVDDYGKDFSDHPEILVKKGKWTSTAAGAYQILSRTWTDKGWKLDQGRKDYGINSFAPANQDKFALLLISRKHGALDNILSGDIEGAIRSTNDEWASLPGAPYGQPTSTMAESLGNYQKYFVQELNGKSEVAAPKGSLDNVIQSEAKKE